MTLAVAKKSNRDIERAYFERFREAYALPPGTVSYADKPDVLVTGQRRRRRRYEVASEAHRLYLADGKHIELTIQFTPNKPITSASRKTLPKRLA